MDSYLPNFAIMRSPMNWALILFSVILLAFIACNFLKD